MYEDISEHSTVKDASVCHFGYFALISTFINSEAPTLADTGIHCYQQQYSLRNQWSGDQFQFPDLRSVPQAVAGVSLIPNMYMFQGGMSLSHSRFHTARAFGQTRSMQEGGKTCLCVLQLAAA